VPFALGSAAAPSITFTGDTNTGIFSPGADIIAFSEGGVESMRIDSSGNVGIGTSSPSQPLTIKSNSASNIAIRILNSSGGVGAIQFTNDPVTTGQAAIESGTGSYLAFQTAASERMRITSDGNVGIGRTTSDSKLYVEDSNPARGIVARIGNSAGGTGAQIQITQSSVADWALGQPAGVNAFAFWSGRDKNGADGTERMRITSTGALLVGTTGLTGGGQFQFSSTSKFTVGSTSGSFSQVQIGNPTSAGEASLAFVSGVTAYGSPPTSTNGNNFIWAIGVGTNGIGSSLGIYNQGFSGNVCQIAFNATSWSFPSDERLKDINGTIEDAVYKIKQLRPVYYTWKNDASKKQKVGLIAQDVLKVLPEAVSVPEKEVKEDGTPNYLSLGMSDVVPLLVSAIQEQQAIITQLQADVAALKGAK
jgi:hypothetical protein